MTTPVPGWPDPAVVLAAALADLGTVLAYTGTDLASMLPAILVQRTGGPDDRVTDQPRMSLTVYAATLAQAKEIAETIRQRLIPAPVVTEAGIIDRARTDAGPAETPVDDPDVMRAVSASYRLSLRRF